MGLDRQWRPISIAAQVVILLDTNAVIWLEQGHRRARPLLKDPPRRTSADVGGFQPGLGAAPLRRVDPFIVPKHGASRGSALPASTLRRPEV
jgi:hypothetical protein